MTNLRDRIIEELGVKPSIDPRAEIDARVQFLADYLRSTPAKGFVLGISGGQDSTLAGKLAQLAAEKLRAEGHTAEFVAVRLPTASRPTSTTPSSHWNSSEPTALSVWM